MKAKWNLTADVRLMSDLGIHELSLDRVLILLFASQEEKKVVQTVVNFDKLDEHKDAFKGHDKGFCLLGTT